MKYQQALRNTDIVPVYRYLFPSSFASPFASPRLSICRRPILSRSAAISAVLSLSDFYFQFVNDTNQGFPNAGSCLARPGLAGELTRR